MHFLLQGSEVTVCFATKTWGGDYKKMLAGAFDTKWQAINYPFDGRLIVMNNGVPPEIYGQFQTLAMVILAMEPDGSVGNVYAVGEKAALASATDFDYLCYVQGDCQTDGGDWVTSAIKILESEPDVLVVSPASDVNTWHDQDGYDYYMSDQAFVVRTKDFRNPEVYQVKGTDPDYPSYGGDSFEAMVGKYLKATGKKRKILSEFWCFHGI